MADEAKAADSTAAVPATPRRPVWRALVERITDHAPDVRSLFLRLDEAQLPPVLPGMFVSIAMALGDEQRVRPYTITAIDATRRSFEIVFNRVVNGRGSAWLFTRRLGDQIEFTGPFGTFTLDRPPAAEIVFVADGVAIAPVRPMVRRALAVTPAPRVTLLYGAERHDHLLFLDELAALARVHPSFDFVTLPPASDIYPLLQDEIRRRWIEGDGNRSRHFYICGVGQPVIALRDLLRGAGYERRAVHYEKW
ncbi:MAG TPA: FAD-dependent oxidoreductase [Candidatus Binataceae bacterium]|jgi:ferredoxin-NADP reductase|nr:FAD-dependent oxidoreductase [Candidatus Binataceae bacterium]